MSGRQVTKGTPAHRKVPALSNAIRILDYLRESDQPPTMSSIASRLEINSSTCFNLLKTLEHERFVDYDEPTKTYRLGLSLLELGLSAYGQRRILEAATDDMRLLATATGNTCLLFSVTDREDFLVLFKVDAQSAFKFTASVGQVFPPNSAVLAKAYYAWQSGDRFDAMVERHGLPPRSPQTITSAAQYREELREVRERGYSTSIGEYDVNSNAVSAPIFDGLGEIPALLTVTGLAATIPEQEIPVVGGQVRDAAGRITQRLGGRPR